MTKFPAAISFLAANIVLAVTAAAGASAQVVFSNGTPDRSEPNGNEMSQWLQADKFTLTGPATLTGASFWDLERNGAFTGTLHWMIYGSTAGGPGVVIAQGDATSVTHSATGFSAIGLSEFKDSFSFNGPSLSIGTYWLGLHNGPLTHQSRDNMYWETSDRDTESGKERIAPFVSAWNSNDQSHAFSLTGSVITPQHVTPITPEPGNAAMLVGMGVSGGVFALSRRRRS